MSLKGTWSLIKESLAEFQANKVTKLSAALAYYTIFSLPAVLIIVIWFSDLFYGHDAVQGKVYAQIAGFIGHDTALQVQQAISNSMLSTNKGMAAAIGIITLIVGAGGVFVEIQDSINQIWHLKAKPRKGRGFLKMVINRLLSFSMVAVLGFLLLVSLVANSVMDIFIGRLSAIFPEAILVYACNMIFTFLVTFLLFAAVFKVLPDARVKWKYVRAGAMVTAILFMLGKFLIGFYLGQSKVSSTYGAAGSVLVVLLWVYYSAIILYTGAVFTRVYALHKSSAIYPNDYAVWVQQHEVPVNPGANK